MIEILGERFNFLIYIILMMIGFYGMTAKGNLLKKIFGMNLFQTAVFLFYVSMAKVEGGATPVVTEGTVVYDNPLPHVLILTAIVVGISVTAVAFALVIRIHKAYGTIEEDEIIEIDQADERRRTNQ